MILLYYQAQSMHGQHHLVNYFLIPRTSKFSLHHSVKGVEDFVYQYCRED